MRSLGSGLVTCGDDLSNERRCLLHRGHTNIHTHVHSDGHRDSMTESAQWADSVKREENDIPLVVYNSAVHTVSESNEGPLIMTDGQTDGRTDE